MCYHCLGREDGSRGSLALTESVSKMRPIPENGHADGEGGRRDLVMWMRWVSIVAMTWSFAAVISGGALAAPTVTDVRVGQHGDMTRLVMDMTQRTDFMIFTPGGPGSCGDRHAAGALGNAGSDARRRPRGGGARALWPVPSGHLSRRARPRPASRLVPGRVHCRHMQERGPLCAWSWTSSPYPRWCSGLLSRRLNRRWSGVLPNRNPRRSRRQDRRRRQRAM